MLQSSTHNLRDIPNTFCTQKFLKPLHNFDACTRIDEIDRAYLDRLGACHEKFERIVRIPDTPYTYYGNLHIQGAHFTRYLVAHTKPDRLHGWHNETSS